MLANNAQPDHHCPTCGQPATLPSPTVVLEMNAVFLDGVTIQLSGEQTEMMYAICGAYPAACAYERIYSAIWGASAGPDDPKNNIQVMAARIRQKIRPHGWNLFVAWGYGYQMRRIER